MFAVTMRVDKTVIFNLINRFLIKHKIKDSYLLNWKNYRLIGVKENPKDSIPSFIKFLDKEFKYNCCQTLLFDSFAWKDTKEGGKFWADKSYELEKIVFNYLDKIGYYKEHQ